MIGTQPPAQSEQIWPALAKVSRDVTQARPGVWNFTLGNGTVLEGSAALHADGWLLLDAPLRGRRTPRPCAPDRRWALLQWNAELPGGAKYALDAHAAWRVRSEIPLQDVNGAIVGRVSDACRGFLLAAQRLRSPKAAVRPKGRPGRAPDDEHAERCDLQHLCREAGWSFVPRASGVLAVELDAPGSFHQATLAHQAGGVHVAVGLGDCAAAPRVCRQAVGLLLLRANGLVRMARAAAERRHERLTIRFEVSWEACPGAAELGHALAALSIACRSCAREVRALLEDEATAKEFVLVRAAHERGAASKR